MSENGFVQSALQEIDAQIAASRERLQAVQQEYAQLQKAKRVLLNEEMRKVHYRPRFASRVGEVYRGVEILRILPRETERGSRIYEMRCSCGNLFTKTYNNLIKLKYPGCGCCIPKTAFERPRKRSIRSKWFSEIGKTYGELEILELSLSPKKGPPIARCRCSCGEEASVRVDNVVHGRTKSCGHLCKIGKKKEEETP